MNELGLGNLGNILGIINRDFEVYSNFFRCSFTYEVKGFGVVV